MTLQIGETVGSYRIVSQLGQGGMATVYKAYHANLDRYVAIKVLHPAFKEDGTFLGRFKREARVLARLDHPNIVPIYDFADHNSQPYLVMKFVEGDTLKGRLARGPLSLGETLKVLDAVGSALAYAHKQGILHRDIKPSNVIITQDEVYYLSDFGLARIAAAGESTLSQDTMLGTPNYISPEQARGVIDLDGRTDIYSFGVVLYELICGRVPFSADTPFSVIHDHIYTPLPPPTTVNPNVSEAIEMFLLKALAKERDDRFADAAAMVAAFHRAVGDQLPGAATHHAASAGTPPVEVAQTVVRKAPIPGAAASLPDSATTMPMPPPASTVRAKAATEPASAVRPKRAAPPQKKAGMNWLLIGSAAVLLLLLAVGGLFILNRIGRGNQRATQAAEVTHTPAPTVDPVIAAAEAAALAAPESVDAQLQLAEAYYHAGLVEQAVGAWNVAGELSDYEPRIYSNRILNFLSKDPVTALEALFAGVKNNNTRVMRELAVPPFDAAVDVPEAESILRRYAAQFPDWPAAQTSLARYYIAQGQPEKAQAIIEEMRVKYGSDLAVKVAHADYLAATGKIDEAIALLQAAAQDRQTPIVMRGLILRRINELTELKGTTTP